MTDEQRKQHNEEKISQLDPSYQPMVREFLPKLETFMKPIIERQHGARRTQDEQQGLFNQGNGVTGAKGYPVCESFHCYGLAVDIIDVEKGYDGVDWNRMGQVAASLGIEHGDRGYTDLPHFQYRGGLSLEEVQQGKRPQLLPKYTNELSEKDMEEIRKELEGIKSRVTALEAIANKEQQMFLNRKTFKKQIKKFLPKKKSKQ